MTTAVATRSVGTPWLAATAIVLSFAAGATDAFAFLRLGGIFTANMTGNLVLIGLTERPGYLNTLFGAIIAVLVFAATVYAAHRIARPGGGLRRGLVIVLAATLLAQIAVLIGWIVSPQPLQLAIQGLLIAFSAIAMAGQTSVSKRVEKHSGVTTTFVTGTITSLMGDFADRTPQDRGIRIGVIFALTRGALSGSLLIGVNPTFGAVLPLVPSLIGLVLITRMPPATTAARSEAL